MSESAVDLTPVKALRYNGNVSQYGWVVDGKLHECEYNGCHSQILSYPEGDLQACYSFGPNIPDIRLEYIFDSAVSPWRSLHVGLNSSKADIAKGSPFIFLDLAHDANLLLNFMTSLRWPNEQIWSYTLWESLLLKGVHPAVADLLTGLVRTRPSRKHGVYNYEKPEFTTIQFMHSNFIPLDLTKEWAENFVNGRMVGGNGNPFKDTRTKGCANDYAAGTKARGYKPIVGAFGKFGGLSFPDQLRGVYGEYRQHLEDTYGSLKDFEHLVDMGHAEQKRLGLSDWGPGQQFARRNIRQTPNGVELRQEAIDEYERERYPLSHWEYVYTAATDGTHAHPF